MQARAGRALGALSRRPHPHGISTSCTHYFRNFSSTSSSHVAPPRAGDFTSGFSSSYDPSVEDGRGPMFDKPSFVVPRFYPRDLKKQVDEYVVGQDRAKKIICSVIFNHYQTLQRRRKDEHEDRMRQERRQRRQESIQRYKMIKDRDLYEEDTMRATSSHPVDDEFPGHIQAIEKSRERAAPAEADDLYKPENPDQPRAVVIDKSNLLLLGPTGAGKTFILETLSKKLNVPFTICDANSMTQAGYIGADPESCIDRLLTEAEYDTEAAEHGIVVIDEIDKIARRETVKGRDVSGEGVQQALLKLIEGTRVTIKVKENRSSRAASPITSSSGTNSMSGRPPLRPSARPEQYTIDTKNILFVFCGAFVGLDKLILRRISKTSMGFGAELGSGRAEGAARKALSAQLFSHLPHQPTDNAGSAPVNGPLDLTTPDDLQAFGFIPEFIGRVHNICALSALTQDELFRILTEPRNSLVAQYTALFETYPSKLHFTRKSLLALAERAVKSKTGARGLKMEMERILAEPMFDAPVPYVLINEACVKGTEKAGYWGKDGRLEVARLVREEDEVEGEDEDLSLDRGTGSSLEQYRQAGQSGA